MRKYIVLLALAISALSAGVLYTQHASEPATDIEAALKRLDIEAALAVAESIQSQDGHSAEAFGMGAVAAERAADLELAQWLTQRAFTLEKSQPDACLALGEIAFGQGRLQEALEWGHLATGSKRLSGEAWLLLAATYSQIGNGGKSAEAAEQALPLVPYLPERRLRNLAAGIAFGNSLAALDINRFSGAKSTTIQAEIRNNKVMIPVRANGQDAGRWVIDTANGGFILITAELARKLEVRRLGSASIRGADGPGQVGLGLVDRLSFGDMELSQVPVMIGGYSNFPWSGNIGRHILMQVNTTIDFNRKTVTFEKRQTGSTNSQAMVKPTARIPFLYRVGLHIIVSIAGRSNEPFVVDTGAPQIYLSESWRKETGLAIDPRRSFTSRGANGGRVLVNGVLDDSMVIAGVLWENLTINSMDFDALFGEFSFLTRGIIGLQPFSDGTIRIDMDSAELLYWK